MTILPRRLPFNRLLPVHVGILLTFALVPVWYRFPDSPGPFEHDFSAGFLIFWPMLWTVGWWLILGLPGFAELRRDRLRTAWALALLLLVCWAFLSWTWAFTRPFRPEVTVGVALPFALSALFALVVACAAPSTRALVAVLVVSLLLHSAIGGWQVARQGPVDLEFLGEFNINPASSGVSVVQADGIRWLRPYGLLPHPNMLAGFLVVGLLAALVWALSENRHRRWLGTAVFLFGLWALLLTFSRAAWVGLAVGGFAALPLFCRRRFAPLVPIRRLLLIAGLGAVTALAFFLLYRPFLSSRAGAGDQSLEQRSISDRNVYSEIAYRVIEKSPLLGLGLGNYPWYASYYLNRFTTYDLRGQPVHHVLLSAWSELGLVGVALVTLVTALGVESGLRSLSLSTGTERDNTFARILLLAAVIALMVIGLFDHYPWTQPHFQVLWWGLLALP